jgi:DNA (cytosine-5)-methyltransferase 1
MKHISLFSGVGGFDCAAEWMSWETIAWCEQNEFCQRVLKYHFPNATGHGDIKTTDFTIYRGKCDILTGGPPCQPVSTAGKRKGTGDDRWLWPEAIRALREIKPRYAVFENPTGLLSMEHGELYEGILLAMEAESYKTEIFNIPACSLGAPHRRERIWIIAYSNSRGWGEGSECQHHKIRERQICKDEQYDGYEVRGEFGDGSNDGITTDTDNERLEGCKIDRSTGSEWPEQIEQPTGCIQPDWENFPTQSPICTGDDGLPLGLSGITFPKWRNESIKALGNSIVPQIAYEIFKAIEATEKHI